MISKESFVRLINAVEKNHGIEIELYNLIGVQPESPLFDLMDSVIDVLEKECNDYTHLISDFCYAHDFGKSYQPSINVYDTKTESYYQSNDFLMQIDGVEYAPKTAEELYEVIVKYNKLADSKGDD